MVQVINLPQSTDARLSEQLGQAISKGVGRNLPTPEQEVTQRYLNEAQKDAESAQGDPIKLAFSLAKVAAVNPGMERSLGQVYQALLSGTKSQQTPEGLRGGVPRGASNPDIVGEISQEGAIAPSPDVPSNAEPVSRDVPSLQGKRLPQNTKLDQYSDDYLKALRPDLANVNTAYGRVPSFDYEMKSDLRPEEEAQIREDLMTKGIRDPATQESVVEKLRNAIQTKFKESQISYNLDKEQLQDIRDKWQNFAKSATGQQGRLEPFIAPYRTAKMHNTANDITNKYFQYASSQPVNLTSEQMHNNSMSLLQSDLNNLDALRQIPSMPPIRQMADATEYMKTVKDAYQPLFEKGYYESLREDAFINKDMGNEEFHSSLFGEQTNKDQLNKLHEVKRERQKRGKQSEAYVNNLSKQLKKMGPKDDLILQRAMVLDNGGTINDFSSALQKAQEDGLNLSAFQQSQSSETKIPRTPPIWEIFTQDRNWGQALGEGFTTGIAGYIVKPFINYLRGKR